MSDQAAFKRLDLLGRTNGQERNDLMATKFRLIQRKEVSDM